MLILKLILDMLPSMTSELLMKRLIFIRLSMQLTALVALVVGLYLIHYFYLFRSSGCLPVIFDRLS